MTATLAATCCLGATGFIVYARWYYAPIFEELGWEDLPLVTELLLGVPGGVLAAIAGLMAPALVAKAFGLRSRRLALVLDTVAASFAASVAAMTWLAIETPFLETLERLR